MADQRVICVIHPNKSAYSETFIRAHLDRLPARVTFLYGGAFPVYRDNGTLLLSRRPLHRLTRAVLRQFFGVPANRFEQIALGRFLRRQDVKAVLAEVGPVGVEVVDVCEKAHIPLLVYLRGADIFSLSILERFGGQYPKLFERAKAILVVSCDIKQLLMSEYGVPLEKIHYNPSGVDTTLFRGANPANASPLFVAVGRFVDNKGHYLTLLAFEKTLKKHPSSRLNIVGDGPLLETCKHMACALDIDHAVEFLGAQPHEEVAALMRSARAFVQHSIRTSNGAEGTPNALKEAGSSGLPVVATRLGGIPEIIIDGKTGYLVNEGDIEEMAEHMVRLAKDPNLAAQLGSAARDWICAEFSMEKQVKKLWAVIADVTANDGTTS